MEIEKRLPLIIGVTLLLVYITDGLTKYFQFIESYNYLIFPNRFFKVVMVFFSVFFMSLTFKKLPKLIYKILALIFVLFLVFITNKYLYNLEYNYFLKFSCFFLFTPVFFIKMEEDSWVKYVVNTLKYLVYCNALLIVLGLVANLLIFKTYHQRFGYNGLLLTAMQSTYFYISSIIIAIKMKDKLFIIVCLISSLIVGTKILLGFSFLICFYLVLFRFRNKKIKIWIFSSLLIASIAAFFVFLNQKLIKSIVSDAGILTAIFSNRNNKLISTWDSLNDINYNLITGGISLENYRIEMAFLDVLMYFGVIGIFVYVLFFKLLKEFFINDKLGWFYFLIILFFIVVGGNFLYYPINCFIFLITLKTLSLTYKV